MKYFLDFAQAIKAFQIRFRRWFYLGRLMAFFALKAGNLWILITKEDDFVLAAGSGKSLCMSNRPQIRSDV
jgi:hypothetical protein